MALQDKIQNLLVCCSTNDNSSWGFSEFSDILQLIVAAINLYLVIYIFRNQQKSQEVIHQEESVNNLKAIKLQGFKDFIVTPNFVNLQIFFTNLLTLRQMITTSQISQNDGILLSEFIKNEVKHFRVNFNDSLLEVNYPLYLSIKREVENLTDDLIDTIVQKNFDLTDSNLFDNRIANPINYTKNKIVSLIVLYEGD